MTALPLRPAVSPDAISAYLLHVGACCSQSSIAAARGVHRSSVHRAVLAVETLRDAPEWDAILTALQDAAMQRVARLSLVDFRIEAAMRAVAGGDAAAPVLAAAPALLARGAAVWVNPALPMALVSRPDGEKLDSLPRKVVLAGLLAGWFDLIRPGPRLSMLRPAPAFLADLRQAMGFLPRTDLPALLRLDLTPGGTVAAHRFARAYRQSPALVDVIRGKMPRELYRPLEICIGQGAGLEEMERACALPAQAGRPLLAAALAVLAAIYATGGDQ